MDRDTPTKVMIWKSWFSMVEAGMMGEKTLHLLAMRSREMSNRLGMKRVKRKCTPSLFTLRPHKTPQTLALGVGLPCTVLAPASTSWRESQCEMYANITFFWPCRDRSLSRVSSSFWPQFLIPHHTRSPRSLNRYQTWLLPSSKLLSLRREFSATAVRYIRTRKWS